MYRVQAQSSEWSVISSVASQAAASYGPTSESVPAARRLVRDALASWGAQHVVDDAVLVVSELVTNAIVHAGTRVDVTCRYDGGQIQIEVVDRHPPRALPLDVGPPPTDREGGRGLYLCATLANSWGVEYTEGTKRVWIRLGEAPAARAERSAPIVTQTDVTTLPSGAREVHVGLIQTDADGCVRSWNHDAVALFGFSPDETHRRPLVELVAPPGGGAPTLGTLLTLPRWEGRYGLRHRDGAVVPVFLRHLSVHTDDDTTAIRLWLVVHEDHEDLLTRPPDLVRRGRASGTALTEVGLGGTGETGGQLSLDDLLKRTVERARDVLSGDASFVLLASENDVDLELRATTGLEGAVRGATRMPAETSLGRVGSARLPAVYDDPARIAVAMPFLEGTGIGSLVTVPLAAEGRIVGTLGVASAEPRAFDNDSAVLLQQAADRVALAVENARLTELERSRRGGLSFLAEASELLAGTLDQDMTISLVAQLIVPRLASWCAVHVVDEGGTPQLAHVWHRDEGQIDVLRALLAKASSPDPHGSAAPRRWTGFTGLGLSGSHLEQAADLVLDSVVTLPLVARRRTLGTVLLGRPDAEGFRPEVLELIEELGHRAALSLDNARLYSDQMATSKALQASLLPPEPPAVAGLDVGVVYVPMGQGNEVGGDFYDLFRIDEHRWAFAIGDVCGKGAEAAAVTGLARHALRILAREGLSVPAVLERLNAAILDEGARGRFLTLLCGEVIPRPGRGTTLRLVSAGHPMPMLLRPDSSVETVGTSQPLLGVLDDVQFSADAVHLNVGDALVCVTDGVTERRSDGGMYGEERLARLVGDCVGLTAAAAAAKVERAVVDFSPEPPRDDLAVLVLRCV
jgi:serine phosphatase RsbU (regulator of sigma subunit)/anti-sigma regulatory factor (Ser/Thr protein kinase)